MKCTLAKHWGLVEKLKEKSPTGQRSPEGRKNSRGLWRLSESGVDFVEARLAVPRSIWVYNDTLYRKSEILVSIQQALKDQFNYDELMKAI